MGSSFSVAELSEFRVVQMVLHSRILKLLAFHYNRLLYQLMHDTHWYNFIHCERVLFIESELSFDDLYLVYFTVFFCMQPFYFSYQINANQMSKLSLHNYRMLFNNSICSSVYITFFSLYLLLPIPSYLWTDEQ